MTISYAQLPAFIKIIQDASRDEGLWLGFDSRIQQLSATDLHFFDTEARALDFQDFNLQQQKQVTLLPVEATRYFLHENARSRLQDGVPSPSIILNIEAIGAIHQEMNFNYSSSMLEELMDRFDWSKISYDPLQANAPTAPIADKIQFNRLEYLVEQLSAFAQTGDRAKAFVSALVRRHWKGQSMEVQIPGVLTGRLATNNIFTHSNINVMNENNLAYLKDNIKYTGFGEALYGELEKNIKELKPDFQLHFTTQLNNKPFNATLQFRKSDNSEMYFFNSYKASLERSNGEKVEQSFQIKKGKSVTAKEAYNLLQGRAVYKDMVNKDNQPYKAWLQLDFDKKDKYGNYEVLQKHENYGYDLKEAVGKFPVLELDGGEKEKDLLRSLEKGNVQSVTMEIDGKQEKMFLEANPQYKTVNVYDSGFNLIKHESLPLKQDQSAQQSIPLEKKQTVGQEEKKNVEQSNAQKNEKGMMNKKSIRNQKGVKIK